MNFFHVTIEISLKSSHEWELDRITFHLDFIELYFFSNIETLCSTVELADFIWILKPHLIFAWIWIKKPIQLIGKTLSKMRIGDCSIEFLMVCLYSILNISSIYYVCNISLVWKMRYPSGNLLSHQQLISSHHIWLI